MADHHQNGTSEERDTPARRAQDRLAFLVEAGNLLATSIELETTLRNVAHLAVPRLADWCGVYRLEDSGDLTQVVAAHADSAKKELLQTILQRYPHDPERPTPMQRVASTGEPVLVPDYNEEVIEATARDPEHRRLLTQLALGSLLGVPLRVDGKVWGIITLATDREKGRLSEDDLSLAQELATRAGMTIGKALLIRDAAEQRRLLKITLASIGDAVIACGASSLITFINPAAEALTGWDAERACGGPIGHVVLIESGGVRRSVDEMIELVLDSGEERELPPDSVLVARDGERVPITGSISPIVDDEESGIEGVVIVLHDITAVRESQIALHRSEERFRLVSDSVTNHAIITLTTDGIIDSWNCGAEMIFRYTGREACGEHSRILFTEEDQAKRVSELEMWQAATEGRAADDRWMCRKGGDRFFANGVTTPIRNEHGDLAGFVKVLQDHTEQKLMQEELERERARAEQASQAKSHFLATLSHELRTPLTPVLTAVQVLAESNNLGEMEQELLQIMARNIEIEARLIDDLLDITRIASGKLQIHRAPVDLHAVITDAIEVCRPQITASELQVLVTLHASESRVLGDAARLQQIFWNLLTNAVKFTPDRGLIRIATESDETHVRARVSDNGIGIEPDLLSKVFSVFEQGDVSVTKRFGGLGLGLSISRAIAEAHGGTISAFSRGRGTGTTFTVELPVTEQTGTSRPN